MQSNRRSPKAAVLLKRDPVLLEEEEEVDLPVLLPKKANGREKKPAMLEEEEEPDLPALGRKGKEEEEVQKLFATPSPAKKNGSVKSSGEQGELAKLFASPSPGKKNGAKKSPEEIPSLVIANKKGGKTVETSIISLSPLGKKLTPKETPIEMEETEEAVLSALPVSALNVSVGPALFPAASYRATVVLTPETPEESSASAYDRLRTALLANYQAPLDGTQYQNKYDLDWNNGQAIQRVYQTITTLKRDPDFLTPKCGGAASWRTVPALSGAGGFYQLIEVKDASDFKFLPYSHVSSVVVGLKLPLGPEEEKALRAISTEARYDPITQRLYVSCDYLGGCIVTAAAVKLFKQGIFSPSEARDLNAEWLKTLRSEWLDDDAAKPVTIALEKYLFAAD